MKGREIKDHHGHTFIAGEYKISALLPREECIRGGRLTLNGDTITHSQFISVKRIDGTYGYIFYENSVYIYGELHLQSYNQKDDMRYEKEK